jgi:HSP20 family protein
VPIVPRWDPFQQLTRMQQELDEVFDRMRPTRGGGEGRAPSSAWVPAVDVARTGSHIVFTLDLPGVNPDDVQIQVQDRTLSIAGERREQRADNHEGYFSRERHVGAFTRTFMLPDGVEADAISADFADGVLRVRVPLPRETQPRRIPVTSGSGRGTVIEAEATRTDEGAAGGSGTQAVPNPHDAAGGVGG